MAQFDLFRIPKRPWNSGRIIGAKPPQAEAYLGHTPAAKDREEDARFGPVSITPSTRVQGCDLVKLRVSDVALGGVLRQRAVIQQKTGAPRPFEITGPTREALTAWLARRGKRLDGWLFPSRSRPGDRISTRQYARLIASGLRRSTGGPTPTVHTASAGRNSPSSSRRLETYAPASCCSAIASWRGRSAISPSS